MFDSINAMVNYAKAGGPLKMTVATAEDADVLLAVKKAVQNELLFQIY